MFRRSASESDSPMILCANPREQYLSYKDEIDRAVLAVMEKGFYILSEEVSAFEKDFARYIGVAHAIGVGSGTEALHMALTACGVGRDDEVITVSHTAVATIAAIVLTGAKPVFVDIKRDCLTIDPDKIEEAITDRTKAIIPVHIYGQAASMQTILDIAKQYRLRVIEDCAQAHGAFYGNPESGKRCGALGDMGCFSFYPTKNLGALGDGGMIVTDDPGLAEKAAGLRQYGWKERYVSEHFGWNSRLDEIQAAVLRVKLKHLDEDNQKRRRIANIYHAGLSSVAEISLPVHQAAGHVYHLYVLRSRKRDALLHYLRANDVMAAVHYPVPVHLQPAFTKWADARSRLLSETESAAREILSLPMYPELRETEATAVVNVLRRYLNNH